MMIAEIPVASSEPFRLAMIGTCRLIGPLRETIRSRKGRFLWGRHNGFTHSPLAARQNYDFTTGRITVTDDIAPYVLRDTQAPEYPDTLDALARGCDALAVEVSSFETLRFRDWYFNTNYFTDMFVRKSGMGMLKWFREVGGNQPSDAVIEEAEADFVKTRGEISETQAAILRELRRERMGDAEVREVLADMVGRARRLVLLPIFRVPGADDHVDVERAEVGRLVSDIANELGAQFIDPSPDVAVAGREAALDGGGGGIHHYAPEFYPTVGLSLLGKIMQGPRKDARDEPSIGMIA